MIGYKYLIKFGNPNRDKQKLIIIGAITLAPLFLNLKKDFREYKLDNNADPEKGIHAI